MTNPLDPLIARVVAWSQRTDRMWVAHDRAWFRRVTVGVLLLGLAGFGAWFAYPHASGQPWGVACGVVAGLLMARGLLMGLRAANAYRSGWLDGRQAFVASMAEAERRGMSPEEWLRSEYARDMGTLGLPPGLPDPPDGLD